MLEGLLIAAFATGASEAIIAVRRDWTAAIERLEHAIAEAATARLAGYLVLGTDFSVQVSVQAGSTSLIHGEETALIAALEGDRGMPVIRPPYPTQRGLHGQPTVVQNGETLAHAAWILNHSAEAFASVGSESSRGTKLVTILGRVTDPGLVEVPMGISLLGLLNAAGAATGTTKALFVGGSGGGAIEAAALDTVTYDPEGLAAAGATIGSGTVLVTDATTCMVATARFFLDLSAREACGKAVPCRIGTKRLVETLDRILAATPRPNDLTLLVELSRKMRDTALCHLESRAPGPMLTTLERFADEYRAHAERGICTRRRLRAARRAAARRPAGRRRGRQTRRIGTIATMAFGTTNGHGNGNGHGSGGVEDYTPLWPMVPGTAKISVTINGSEVQAEEGQTILQACRVLGIDVPTLCYEPKLAPYGACRICVVEVEGREDTPISCGTQDRPRGWSSPPTPIGSSRTGAWCSS